jgi:hypothetical protein
MADTAIVILTGQSLNAWRGSTRFLETGWSGARQFVGGGAAAEMDFAAINEVETPDHNDTASVVTQAETSGGQSPISGIASALSGAGFTRVYLYSAAIGSRAYDAQFGSGIFQSVVTGVQRMIELAAGQGDTDPDIFFYHAHGEKDAFNGRTAEQYRDDTILWTQRLQLLAAQYLERPTYRAPVFLSQPIQSRWPTPGSDSSRDRAIKHGMKLAVDSDDTEEIYILPAYSTTQNVDTGIIHPSEEDYVRRGEYVGFLIKDYLAGTVYEPLRISSVTRSGATVTVQFTDSITRDTSGGWSSTANGVDGFEYFDNGSEITISGVVYSGDTATITLNSTPVGSDAQQVLRIALQTPPTSPSNKENMAGSYVRRAGAGVASVTNAGWTHHDYAIAEEISGFPYEYTPPSPASVLGTISATESSDVASFSGAAIAEATVDSTESGDVASFSGSVVDTITGTINSTEASDVASFSGAAIAEATVDSTESGDVASFTGSVVDTITGTIDSTEASDVASFSGAAIAEAAIDSTESSDIASFSGTVVDTITGTVDSTEASDVASFSGAAIAAGTIDSTESSDAASFSGALIVAADIDVVESGDVASFSGSVVDTITGTINSTETGDIASFSGAALVTAEVSTTESPDGAVFDALVDVNGSIVVTETQDSASFSATVGDNVNAVIDATESSDIASFSVTVDVSGAIDSTESSDVASFTGSVVDTITGTINSTEASDVASFSGALLVAGTVSATESSDTATFSGTVGNAASGTIDSTESGDLASFSGTITASGAVSSTESSDVAALTAAVTITGAVAATESADTASFTGTAFAPGTLTVEDIWTAQVSLYSGVSGSFAELLVNLSTSVAAITAQMDDLTRLIWDNRGAVYIDTGSSNTLGSPVLDDGLANQVGTVSTPLNTLADARVLADARGLKEYGVQSDVTVDTDHEAWTWRGQGDETLTFSGVSVAGSTFRNLTLTGASTGAIRAEKCTLSALTAIAGTMEECTLSGLVSVSGTTVLSACNARSATLSVAASSTIHLPQFSGALTVTGLTTGCVLVIDAVAADVTFAASCTGGTVILRGPVKVTNNGTLDTLDLSGAIDTVEADIARKAVAGNAEVSGDDLTVTIKDDAGATLRTLSVSADGRVRTID